MVNVYFFMKRLVLSSIFYSGSFMMAKSQSATATWARTSSQSATVTGAITASAIALGNNEIRDFAGRNDPYVIISHYVIVSKTAVRIISNDGKSVKLVSPAMGSSQTAIDLSNFTNGSYHLQFSNGNNLQTIQIQKQ